jgi:hypothetical protein
MRIKEKVIYKFDDECLAKIYGLVPPRISTQTLREIHDQIRSQVSNQVKRPAMNQMSGKNEH